MTRVLRWLKRLLLLLTLVAIGLLVAAIDLHPLVERDESISPTTIAQAKRLFRVADPRQQQRGETRTVAVPVGMLDEGVNYLAYRFLHGRGALLLGENGAELRLSLPLGGVAYANLRAWVDESTEAPQIGSAYLGDLPVPASWLEYAIRVATNKAGVGNEWNKARQAVQRLHFDRNTDSIHVTYIWEPTILSEARAFAFKPEDLVRLQAAQSILAGHLNNSAGKTLPLAKVLKPLLAHDASDPIAQRRAALLVLAIYLFDKDLAGLVPEARYWPRPRYVALTLFGRHDSAQHYGISAALAAWAGEPVADAIGLYKELEDARHGSGFSFADLAADRAGTRLGELVVGDSKRLDAALLGPFTESEIAPALLDLPENLNASEFRRRFGDTSDARYRKLTDVIEQRIAALTLYR